MLQNLIEKLSGLSRYGRCVLSSSATAVINNVRKLGSIVKRNPQSVASFPKVFRDELLQLEILDRNSIDVNETINHKENLDRAWAEGLFGLAFSGGGIRSATFNLGVIQALCELKLLRQVHYLSVVSGGGYIGGWLTSLMHRRNDPNLSREQQFAEWEGQLSAESGREDEAISHLRNFSNYLTPKKGAATADTWSAIATYLRNVLLNQSILIATLLSLLIIGWLSTYGISWLRDNSVSYWESALSVSIIASLFAGLCIGYNLASIADSEPKTPNGFSDRGVFFCIVLPAVAGAAAACIWLPYMANVESLSAPELFPEWLMELPRWAVFMVLAGAINLLVWALAFFVAALTGWHHKRMTTMWLHILWSGMLSAGVLGALLWFGGSGLGEANDFVVFVVAPPLVLIWLFLVATLHTGLVGTGMGSHYREWLSRVGAWLLISAAAWGLLAGLTLLGPFVIEWAGDLVKGALVSGWIATTLAGLLASRQQEGASPGYLRKLLFAVAPIVFILGLMALLSVGAKQIVLGDSQPEEKATTALSVEKFKGIITTTPDPNQIELEISQVDHPDQGLKAYWNSYHEQMKRVWKQNIENRFTRISLILVLLILGVIVVSWRANVNEFSLRNMYKNRLVRGYLGASSNARYAQPFTGFSVYDDLWMGDSR